MNKLIFTKGVNQMREFCLWLDKIEKAGLDLNNQYLDSMIQTLHFLLMDGKSNWDYDEREGHNWIIEYTGDSDFSKKYNHYQRNGRSWDLSDAGNLFDFLTYMNDTGWNGWATK